MATRSFRLSEFSQSAPETNEPVEVLCEDHNGTYLVPYFCCWCKSKWHNWETGLPLTAKVVGWRKPKPHVAERSK